MTSNVAQNLAKILAEISKKSTTTNLIAVSKTKPISMILEAYLAGQRHFGENYIQELVEKSHNDEILNHCPDIKWHMIGPIQSNKVKLLCTTKNLYAVHTISSEKLVNKFNNSLKEADHLTELRAFIQINSSGEASKSGLNPENFEEISKLVTNMQNSDKLKFAGLMTIGRPKDAENSHHLDFQILKNLAEKLENCELSMGMSSDFIEAIDFGSNYVRVGSSIFGARDYSQKK